MSFLGRFVRVDKEQTTDVSPHVIDMENSEPESLDYQPLYAPRPRPSYFPGKPLMQRGFISPGSTDAIGTQGAEPRGGRRIGRRAFAAPPGMHLQAGQVHAEEQASRGRWRGSGRDTHVFISIQVTPCAFSASGAKAKHPRGADSGVEGEGTEGES